MEPPPLHADDSLVLSWLPALLRGQWDWLSEDDAQRVSNLQFAGIKTTSVLRVVASDPTRLAKLMGRVSKLLVEADPEGILEQDFVTDTLVVLVRHALSEAQAAIGVEQPPAEPPRTEPQPAPEQPLAAEPDPDWQRHQERRTEQLLAEGRKKVGNTQYTRVCVSRFVVCGNCAPVARGARERKIFG